MTSLVPRSLHNVTISREAISDKLKSLLSPLLIWFHRPLSVGNNDFPLRFRPYVMSDGTFDLGEEQESFSLKFNGVLRPLKILFEALEVSKLPNFGLALVRCF